MKIIECEVCCTTLELIDSDEHSTEADNIEEAEEHDWIKLYTGWNCPTCIQESIHMGDTIE